MAKFQHKLALAAVISFCGLEAMQASPAYSSTLLLGLKENLQNYYLVSKQDRASNLTSLSQVIGSTLVTKGTTGMTAISAIDSDYAKLFLEDEPQQIKEELRKTIAEQSANLSTAEEINQHIQDRYYGLIEEDTEQMSLLATRQLLMSEGLVEQATAEDMEKTVSFLQSEGLIADTSYGNRSSNYFPKPLLVGLLIILGWRIVYIFSPLSHSVDKSLIWGEDGIFEIIRQKFGKPKVPEGVASMHEKTFKELKKNTKQAQRIDEQLPGSQEFSLLVEFKQAVKQGQKEYQKLFNSVQLLKAALDTQSSFFKIEQIESRFCSSKQQEMYAFVEKQLSQNINITEFRTITKNKLAEIITLLNTDEGKQALQSYLNEINIISKHELGLKLLSLFKQYQLADYTILKKVSDMISLLEGKDLLDRTNSVNLVFENYQIFEKLSLIIGVSESKNSSDIYATILQYVALLYRHQDSYDKFEQLLKILKKWQKPYQSVMAIRQEYNSSNYRLPKEFFQPIPGLNVYKKYEKYVD